jgi:hypothetical protein
MADKSWEQEVVEGVDENIVDPLISFGDGILEFFGLKDSSSSDDKEE